METIVIIAMNKTKGWGSCWWMDELTNAVIDEAVKLGWLLRPSTTQVEWTEKGVEAVKDFIPKP